MERRSELREVEDCQKREEFQGLEKWNGEEK